MGLFGIFWAQTWFLSFDIITIRFGRLILNRNGGIIFLLAHSLNFQFFGAITCLDWPLPGHNSGRVDLSQSLVYSPCSDLF